MALVLDAEVVLLDIEGTIASQSFVLDVLFGYSRARMADFVAARRGDPEIEAILADVAARAGGTDPVAALLAWQDADQKIPPLKKLQGRIWESGYKEGAYVSHIYDDALIALRRFKAAGLPLYIFSSGSVQAHIQYFQFSSAGDLRSLFDGHFDTDIGAKVEAASYQAIADTIGARPSRIVFFSDNPRELEAAAAAGIVVVHVVKGNTPSDPRFPEITDFSTVELRHSKTE